MPWHRFLSDCRHSRAGARRVPRQPSGGAGGGGAGRAGAGRLRQGDRPRHRALAGRDPADVGSANFERDAEMSLANNAREINLGEVDMRRQRDDQARATTGYWE